MLPGNNMFLNYNGHCQLENVIKDAVESQFNVSCWVSRISVEFDNADYSALNLTVNLCVRPSGYDYAPEIFEDESV